MYILKFTDSALTSIKALPKNARNALKKELLKTVRINPERCSCELHGPLQHYRSLHWRDYRVVFRIFVELKIVAIVGIGAHSSDEKEDVYRRLEALVGTGKLAETVLASLRGFTDVKRKR